MREMNQVSALGDLENRWALTPAEHRAWLEEGYFVRPRVFTETEIVEFRAAAERVVAIAGSASAAHETASYSIDGNRYSEVLDATVQFEHQQGSGTIRVVEPFHHLDAAFNTMIDDPRIVVPIRSLVGTERVALFTDKINLKRPHQGSAFRWHQDSPYWSHFCSHLDQLPNVMLAMDDASIANGCFRVIRGSHRHGALPGQEGRGRLGPLFTDPAYVDLDQQVPLEMPLGSLAFFSPHTVHGSQPNDSGLPRRAIVLTYQPAGHRMFKIDAVRDCPARTAA
ncbi:phytanoyl-CoA dioxygenase family protein [Myxococcota bacterium]|nr:phytanoyl-CoA dioxygenase family protein [Myxococcota bacterium]